MIAWLRWLAVLPFFAALWPKPDADRIILVAGNFAGNLSPCGCTKPMSGGIRRMGTAIEQNSDASRTLILYSGPMSGGQSRQDELKVEAAAEALGKMGFDAVGLSYKDALLGMPILEGVHRLSKKSLVQSELAGREDAFSRTISKQGFQVRSVSSHINQMVNVLEVSRAEEPARPSQPTIVLFDGNRAEAEAYVRSSPKLALVVYTLDGEAPSEPERVNNTWLVSPGEHGKALLKLRWDGKKFSGYEVIGLGPQFADDPAVSKVYRAYLERVAQEGLLDLVPRRDSAQFAGSTACKSCHEEAHDVWLKSKHGSALETLEEEHHDRDPDCVSCHVVGLEAKGGFVSRAKTPDLANVGCESCHGPAADHANAPEKVLPKKLTRESCLSCHSLDHSPGFDFESYWKKIKHD